MMMQQIYKYEPFWQEVSVASLILRRPLRPLGFLFGNMKYMINTYIDLATLKKVFFADA